MDALLFLYMGGVPYAYIRGEGRAYPPPRLYVGSHTYAVPTEKVSVLEVEQVLYCSQ